MKYGFPHAYVHGRYREIYALSHVSERQVQENILEYLRLFSVDAVALDAGGKAARRRLIAAARQQGVPSAGLASASTPDIPKGWADIEATLAPEGRALFIEVKAPRWVDGCGRTVRAEGRATMEQLEWLAAKQARGALVLVAWAVEDVEAHLGSELARNGRAIRSWARNHNMSR
jgi:hypothetical protein